MNTTPRPQLALAGVLLFLAGCAQTGPPLPPSLELPQPPTDLRATRKGNSVTLVWTEPTRTMDRVAVRYLGPTNVCRSVAAEMSSCGNPVSIIAAPSTPIQQPKTAAAPSATYSDKVPEAVLAQNPEDEITYAVEVFNQNGRSAGLSNRARVPAVPTLPPPSDFAAQLTGDGVVLTWTSASEIPQVPDVQYRYRIYRRDETTGKDSIAGEVPATQAAPERFLDVGLEWERTYLYRVTAVSIVNRNGVETQVEGDDTPAIRILAHDVFPPNVPSGLQAVYSSEGQKSFVDLIWAPVTNADLAGYNVYRQEEGGSVVKLNSELVKSPAYRDSAVLPGKTYGYFVSTMDVRGNESGRSEEARETVPSSQ